MPRRPRKQPRPSSGVKAAQKNPVLSRKTGGKIQKWVQRKDVQGNEEDQFYETRDRILLEGEGDGDEEWSEEEEVFGLELENDSEDDTMAKGQGDAADIIESDEEEEPSSFPHKPKKTKKKTTKKPDTSPLPSETESEESESWGRQKSAYYASNADLLADKEGEEDEEEANEMEEREARRLQARMRDTMEDEDYGLVDMANLAANDVQLEEDDQSISISQSISLSKTPIERLDRATALRHLEKTYPETLALARDWDDVVLDLMRIQQKLDKPQSNSLEPVSLGLSHLHHQTLLTYITTLAFFLHVRAGLPTATQSNTSSRVKPVMQRLLTLKQALSTMEELDFDASDEDDENDEDDEEFDASYLDDVEKAELERIFGPLRGNFNMEEGMDSASGRKKKLGVDELDALLRDADVAIDENAMSRIDERPVAVNGEKHHSRKATKGSKKATLLKIPTFDLVEPTFVPSKRRATRLDDSVLDAYGEATALSMADDTDKKARKRSLRFHTHKIETSARRREEGREKLGGDDDIPYRERKKEKEARVRREAEKTRGEGGEDLDVDVGHEASSEESANLGTGKRKRHDDDASNEDSEDGYYELVKRAKKDKKEGKKREYEEARLNERLNIVGDDTSGPRSLTRAILKNKGLIPRRPKSVRNPRVKKRERFEKAKKKVRSQKAVYKGGLSGKPYGGEESGITKVVKSVKL